VTRAEWQGVGAFFSLHVGHYTIEVWKQDVWRWDVILGKWPIVRGRDPACATAAKAAAVAALRKVLTDALEQIGEEVQP
jgi:hypothetical protein